MTECPVCCEKFSSKVRIQVDCNYCKFACCRQCVQRYLTEITNDPHCMQCKNAWNREFVDAACTKTFRNHTLKTHRENLLFEREKCFLPDAQVILAHRKESDRLVAEYNEKIHALTNEIHNLHVRIQRVRTTEVPSERRKFVRKCPVTACRGFLSSQWKCEVCENKICKECNEIKDDDDHACKPENVETMKLLSKDTKSCPKCGTMIFKISGCAQMWCPDCHTAFNWNTRAIEMGVIHNPHFFDFQRLGGGLARNPGDIPCGGIPNLNDLYAACNISRYTYRNTIPPESKFVFDFCRAVIHVEQVEMVREPVDNSLELRIKYLSNTLGDEEYKSILQKNEKAREKRRDVNNILTMLVHTGSDILRQFVTKQLSVDQLRDITTNLVKYTNTTLSDISKRYSCVVPLINEETFDIGRRKYNGRDG